LDIRYDPPECGPCSRTANSGEAGSGPGRKRKRDRLAFLRKPGFHLAMTIVWMALLVPTLIWWKSSILWVAGMSLYANVAAHWSAFQGARAEREAGSGDG
jgi:hypothetical protein